VIDVGQSFAIEAANQGYWRRTVTTGRHSAGQKAPGADWYGDYGGYVAIGCDSKTSKLPTFQADAQPGMGYKIGINNNPTSPQRLSRRCGGGSCKRGLAQQHQAGVDWFRS